MPKTLLALVAALLASCSSSPKCVQGLSVQCGCTNGSVGAQVCGVDGAFGPCVCNAGNSDAGGRSDAGTPDAGASGDAGTTGDSGFTSQDGGSVDAGVPNADGGGPDGGDGGNPNPCLPQSGVAVLASGNWLTQAAAANSAGYYWLNNNSPALDNPGAVMALPFNTCAPQVIGQTYSPGQLFAEAQRLYWSDTDSSNVGYIKSSLLDGGNVAALVIDSKGVGPFAVDAQYLYWADTSGIQRVLFDGGSQATLVAAGDYPRAIAVDATTLYWATQNSVDGGTLLTMPKDGSTPPQVLLHQLLYPESIWLSGSSVYMSNFGTSGIGPYAGSIVSTQPDCVVSPDQSFPNTVVGDSSYVYWSGVDQAQSSQTAVYAVPLGTCLDSSPGIIVVGGGQGLAISSAGLFFFGDSAAPRNIERFSW
jgi:hypothetical protein